MFGQTNPFGQSSNSPFTQFGQTNTASSNPIFSSQPGGFVFGGSSTGLFGPAQSCSPAFPASSSPAFGISVPSFGAAQSCSPAVPASSSPAFGISVPSFGAASTPPCEPLDVVPLQAVQSPPPMEENKSPLTPSDPSSFKNNLDIVAMNESLLGNFDDLLKALDLSPEWKDSTIDYSVPRGQLNSLLALGFPNLLEPGLAQTVADLATTLYFDPTLTEEKTQALTTCIDLPLHADAWKAHQTNIDDTHTFFKQFEKLKQSGISLREKHETQKAKETANNDEFQKLVVETTELEKEILKLQQQLVANKATMVALQTTNESSSADMVIINQNLQTLVDSLAQEAKQISALKIKRRSAEKAQEHLLAKLTALSKFSF